MIAAPREALRLAARAVVALERIVDHLDSIATLDAARLAAEQPEAFDDFASAYDDRKATRGKGNGRA